VRIYNAALAVAYKGAATDSSLKQAEYLRLRDLARAKGWSVGWVVREYRKLFGTMPDLSDVRLADRYAEYCRMRDFAAERGWKSGYAAARYRDLFGQWPPWEWRNAA
jgi:hypothetical protein